MGGFRYGSGRSKTGYYKGIYCGSTYELCWVIYQIDHKVKFSRFPGRLQHADVVYFPDFLIGENEIIELKGYEAQTSVDRKTKAAEALGYSVTVLRKEDLQDIFAYVEATYGTKKFHTLYDGYKPRYVCVCGNCKEQFATERKNATFCSRKCAGRFRQSTNIRDFNLETASFKRKLDKETALAVYNSKGSLSEIAVIFGIAKNNVWAIKQKRSYKWIHMAP